MEYPTQNWTLDCPWDGAVCITLFADLGYRDCGTNGDCSLGGTEAEKGDCFECEEDLCNNQNVAVLRPPSTQEVNSSDKLQSNLLISGLVFLALMCF